MPRTRYQKKAHFQRQLLMVLVVWNGIASIFLIANVIHHW